MVSTSIAFMFISFSLYYRCHLLNFDATFFALQKFIANIFIVGCMFYHYKEPLLFALMLFHPWIQPYLV